MTLTPKEKETNNEIAEFYKKHPEFKHRNNFRMLDPTKTLFAERKPRKKRKPRKSHLRNLQNSPIPTKFDFTLWTDGSCLKNPGGPGGWGFVTVEKGKTVAEHSGHCPETTNNRMEMQAIIEGLNSTPKQSSVIVKTDSQLLVRCFKGIYRRHKNLDLWKLLFAAAARHKLVVLEWVKAHAGIELNERADYLAGIAAKKG